MPKSDASFCAASRGDRMNNLPVKSMTSPTRWQPKQLLSCWMIDRHLTWKEFHLLFSNHLKVFESIFDRLFLIYWALWLLCVIRLRLIVAFPLNDSAFPLDLRDIQRWNRKTCVFLDVSFDFVTGCGSMAFGRRYTSLPISSLMAILFGVEKFRQHHHRLKFSLFI